MSATGWDSEYARGLTRGSTLALSHLLEIVEEHRTGVEDPTATGPTWDGLIQLLRDSLSRVQEMNS